MTRTDPQFRGTGEEKLNGEVFIHPMAHVAKGAELDRGVSIGPGAIIGPDVKIASEVSIGAHVVISGKTTIGSQTQIFPFATIGSDPQDLKYKGEPTRVEIGEKNNIREYVNISLGTEGGGGITRIGNNNLIMVYTHLGHDCIVGNSCIFANSVQLAGHVEVSDGAVFGGMSAAHQFTRIGGLAMIAAGSMVSQDVPTFCMVKGDRARINGLNVVGLRRAKIANLSDVKKMYKLLYHDNLTQEDAIQKIIEEVPQSPVRDEFVDFLQGCKRGICR